jgi:hypothetical protein
MRNRSTSLRNPDVSAIQHVGTFAISSAILLVLTLVSVPAIQSQTFSVIHNFTGGAPDGGNPVFGVVPDRHGNLYGITADGGDLSCMSGSPPGCGAVYKITPAHTLSTLYTFMGGSDGAIGNWLTLGPDGTLYGTTLFGGNGPCFEGDGCGTVFNLQPPSPTCSLCPWRETVLYRFQGPPDGSAPRSMVFDSHGNIFGLAENGGAYGYGVVFELMPSASGWTEQVIYTFTGGFDGGFPRGLLAIDSLGNLYGIGSYGRYGRGVVFELSPSASGWTETTLVAFVLPGGTFPEGGLIFDPSGNLYGGTFNQRAVYELSPSGGGWDFRQRYLLPGSGGGSGINAPLAMDSAGNFYGTTYGSDTVPGTVYELTASGGGFSYTLLHQFSGFDGGNPTAAVSFDPSGSLYSTTSTGGANGFGVVWEISP